MDLAVIVCEADDGGYWADVVQLPGRVSQGGTLDELRTNTSAAIEAVYQTTAAD